MLEKVFIQQEREREKKLQYNLRAENTCAAVVLKTINLQYIQSSTSIPQRQTDP
jgi:hypothetical protein